MDKPKIAILFGGCSSEYDISLQSAYSVIASIDESKYDTVLLGITQSGEWFRFFGELIKIREDAWQDSAVCVRAVISPDREAHGIVEFGADGVRTVRLDAAMPVLHGKNGEDGTIQGLLALAGIPVIGCNTLSSALCMDKDKAHKLAHLAGVRAPRSYVLSNGYSAAVALSEAEKLGYPLFVKPVKSGSSLGITMVMGKEELPEAIALGFTHDDKVLMEENIAGFEVGCAILGNDKLVVSGPDEIELVRGFFDYKEKYDRKTAVIHERARITAEKAAEIEAAAEVVYRVLDCSGFARVDLFLTPEGEIVFNEVNTIPGLTTCSRYPNMLKAAGMTFGEVINTMIDLAVDI